MLLEKHKEELVEMLLSQSDRIVNLQKQLASVEDKLTEVEKVMHRQAAPFRKKPKALKAEVVKKTPGRKPGHMGSYRPVPAQVDEVIEVPLDACPHCGGKVSDHQPTVYRRSA